MTRFVTKKSLQRVCLERLRLAHAHFLFEKNFSKFANWNTQSTLIANQHLVLITLALFHSLAEELHLIGDSSKSCPINLYFKVLALKSQALKIGYFTLQRKLNRIVHVVVHVLLVTQDSNLTL